jgi:hypothetical protein
LTVLVNHVGDVEGIKRKKEDMNRNQKKMQKEDEPEGKQEECVGGSGMVMVM